MTSRFWWFCTGWRWRRRGCGAAVLAKVSTAACWSGGRRSSPGGSGAPVHHGVEVQVEDRLLGAANPPSIILRSRRRGSDAGGRGWCGRSSRRARSSWQRGQPANSAARSDSSRSSTWRPDGAVSLSASSASSQLVAARFGAGSRLCRPCRQIEATRSAPPAAARPWPSRPAPARCEVQSAVRAVGVAPGWPARWRPVRPVAQPPKPSSDRISATLVRLSGICSSPAARRSRRPKALPGVVRSPAAARSLAGATPVAAGLRVRRTAQAPARCSRTRFTIAHRYSRSGCGVGVAEAFDEERAQRFVAAPLTCPGR